MGEKIVIESVLQETFCKPNFAIPNLNVCYYKDMMLGFLQLQFDKNSKVSGTAVSTARLNHSLENLQFVRQSTPITMGASIFWSSNKIKKMGNCMCLGARKHAEIFAPPALGDVVVSSFDRACACA